MAKFPDIDEAFAAVRASSRNLTCLAVRTRLRRLWVNHPNDPKWLAHFQRSCRELGSERAWLAPDPELCAWHAKRCCVAYLTSRAVLTFVPRREDSEPFFDIKPWDFIRWLRESEEGTEWAKSRSVRGT